MLHKFMLSIHSETLLRLSMASPITINLTSIEDDIFSFIKEASARMPESPVARVAGGWVRDKLLGKPSKDIDITVDKMKGVQFAQKLQQYAYMKWGNGQQVVGNIKDTTERPEQIKNLAVAFLRIYGQDVEILNLRGKEVYEEGSRNPISVSEATPEEDAHRRDLTINSMFYNINTGQVEDFTGKGYDDLATMTLRTPLDPVQTFTDDPLRLLRVLRFYSRYPNSTVAPEVVEAMRDPKVQHQIVRKIANPNDAHGIVVERTAEELRKMMKGSRPDKALRLMFESGLLAQMLNLPGDFHPLHMDQRNRWHSLSVIDHTLEVVKNVNNLAREFQLSDDERMMMNLAALFHDLGKLDPRSHKNKPDGTRGYSGNPQHTEPLPHENSSRNQWNAFAGALKLSNEESNFIGELVSGHMRPHAHVEDEGPNISDKSMRRYLRKNPNWMFQYIHAMADAMSKKVDSDPVIADPYRRNMGRLQQLSLDPLGNKRPSTDLLNGNQIIQIVNETLISRNINPKQLSPKTGYIEVVKERIREIQDEQPSLSPLEAENAVRTMVSAGELDKFFSNIGA